MDIVVIAPFLELEGIFSHEDLEKSIGRNDGETESMIFAGDELNVLNGLVLLDVVDGHPGILLTLALLHLLQLVNADLCV